MKSASRLAVEHSLDTDANPVSALSPKNMTLEIRYRRIGEIHRARRPWMYSRVRNPGDSTRRRID